MNTLYQYLIEKLKLTKDSQITNTYNDSLDDLLKHFEFDSLFEIDKGRLMKEPYITKEEGEEIKNVLLDFIENNDCKKENFRYYTNRGAKFKDKKIDRDYKKGGKYLSYYYYNDEHILFTGNYGLKFAGNPKNKAIMMFGPLGGVKICRY